MGNYEQAIGAVRNEVKIRRPTKRCEEWQASCGVKYDRKYRHGYGDSAEAATEDLWRVIAEERKRLRAEAGLDF